MPYLIEVSLYFEIRPALSHCIPFEFSIDLSMPESVRRQR